MIVWGYVFGLALLMVYKLWERQPVGTRSVLCGAHAWCLHPWFVAAAWNRLYGFPTDIHLWVAFFIHDWGYWGCAHMDDEKGEQHPLVGAWLMDRVCNLVGDPTNYPSLGLPDGKGGVRYMGKWGHFCLLHSRYFAKRLEMPYSRLCVADKLAFKLTPWWIYLPLTLLTGEVQEYLLQALASHSTRFNALRTHHSIFGPSWSTLRLWHRLLGEYMEEWAYTHRRGEEDTWTQKRFESTIR